MDRDSGGLRHLRGRGRHGRRPADIAPARAARGRRRGPWWKRRSCSRTSASRSGSRRFRAARHRRRHPARGASTPPSTGIDYNTDVIQRDRNQSEFTKQIWDYLDSAVSDDAGRERQRRAERQHRDTGRDRGAATASTGEVVVAIWGLESAYGALPRLDPTSSRRWRRWPMTGGAAAFFEEQLIAALRILQAGDVAPRAMTGSWAGAMGHTQFMPTSYLVHARRLRRRRAARHLVGRPDRRAGLDRGLPCRLRLDQGPALGRRGACCRRASTTPLPASARRRRPPTGRRWACATPRRRGGAGPRRRRRSCCPRARAARPS